MVGNTYVFAHSTKYWLILLVLGNTCEHMYMYHHNFVLNMSDLRCYNIRSMCIVQWKPLQIRSTIDAHGEFYHRTDLNEPVLVLTLLSPPLLNITRASMMCGYDSSVPRIYVNIETVHNNIALLLARNRPILNLSVVYSSIIW